MGTIVPIFSRSRLNQQPLPGSKAKPLNHLIPKALAPATYRQGEPLPSEYFDVTRNSIPNQFYIYEKPTRIMPRDLPTKMNRHPCSGANTKHQ